MIEYDLLHIAAFVLIGTISGVIATLIGGASLIAFPALIALGLSPIEAAIAQIVALSPSGFAAAYFDRAMLPRMERPIIILLLVAVICAPIGAILLVLTPPESFKLLVPLLLALATILFACAKPISAFIGKKFASRLGRYKRLDQRHLRSCAGRPVLPAIRRRRERNFSRRPDDCNSR